MNSGTDNPHNCLGAERQVSRLEVPSIDLIAPIALVTNAAVYVLQHLMRLYLTLVGGAVAIHSPEAGQNWFLNYALGMVLICVMLLAWTAMLPHESIQSRRKRHILVICMSALNLSLAIGTLGLLATMSEQDFNDLILRQ